MQQEQPLLLLKGAAARAFGADSPVKHALALRLLDAGGTTATLPLPVAAAASRLPAQALLSMLQADPCFRVVFTAADISVVLDCGELLRRARERTSTGVLRHELQEPTGGCGVVWVGVGGGGGTATSPECHEQCACHQCPSPPFCCALCVVRTGYTDNVYPIRPGQPNCTHFLQTGRCGYRHKCVFNHRE
jgi:hypothetical protein